MLITLSCNPESNLVNPNGITDTFTMNHFPMKVGNWWKYQIIDSSGAKPKTDTATLKVVELKIINSSKEYKCYWEINGIYIDSSLVIFKDSTISFMKLSPVDYSYIGEFEFKLPFKKGDTWTSGNNSEDTVLTNDTNTVILGRAYNSFNIKMLLYISLHNATYYSMNVANGIGIIYAKIYRHWDFDIIIAKDISLIDYHLE